MNKKILALLTFLNLSGIVLSLILIQQHYAITHQGLAGKSLCNINQWINCDVVNASSYAEIYSIPIAGLGLIYYSIIFFYSLIALISDKIKKGGLSFAFYLSAIALLFTFYTAFVSLFKLHALCLFCSGLYLVTLLNVLLLPFSFGSSLRSIFTFTKNYLKNLFRLSPQLGFEPHLARHVAFTIIFYGIGILIFSRLNAEPNKTLTHQEHPATENTEFFLKIYFEQQPVSLNPLPDFVWGNPKAQVKIIEFSDFECPYCQMAALNLKPALAEYKDEIAFYFVNYPLDNSCNIYIQRVMHQNACSASKAAYCASKEGKFWEYHDLVFENQKKLAPYYLVNYAEQLGMKRDPFIECMNSNEALSRIQQDIEIGKSVGVTGTPTIFINGRHLPNWNNVKILRAVIEEELKRSHQN